MLDTLLESRAKKRRPIAGALVSVGAHTLLIAGAVYATAQARSAPAPATNVRPIYFVRPDNRPARSAASAQTTQHPGKRPVLKFFDVPTINVDVPRVDLSDVTTRPDDFGADHLIADASSGLPGGSTNDPGSAFRADQVERQVALKPGNAPPVYPSVLRNAGVEGDVIAMFVVNESGQAEDSTVRFVSSDNRLFDDAVRAALRRMRFIPAEVGGKKVRQLVEMPFVFTLRK